MIELPMKLHSKNRYTRGEVQRCQANFVPQQPDPPVFTMPSCHDCGTDMPGLVEWKERAVNHAKYLTATGTVISVCDLTLPDCKIDPCDFVAVHVGPRYSLYLL